jgi:hypothetical protein
MLQAARAKAVMIVRRRVRPSAPLRVLVLLAIDFPLAL